MLRDIHRKSMFLAIMCKIQVGYTYCMYSVMFVQRGRAPSVAVVHIYLPYSMCTTMSGEKLLSVGVVVLVYSTYIWFMCHCLCLAFIMWRTLVAMYVVRLSR